MDWTPWIGHARPVEEDALRLLTVVHQLGVPAPDRAATGRAATGRGFRRCVTGERRLRQLDHLVCHPIDLAFLLTASYRLSAVGRRRAALVREVRQLVAGNRAAKQPAKERLHGFHGGAWRRWDDVLAWLECRRLLAVRTAGETPDALVYGLTDVGSRHLRGLYASLPGIEPYRQRCRIVRRRLFAAGRGTADPGVLEAGLRETSDLLDAFRLEEQLAPEDDLLGRFFQSTFGEQL